MFALRAKRVLWMVSALTTMVVGGLSLPSFAQKTSTVSRSPHGDLNIPCQNCHTSVGWKPIRAVPEFDHNQTKYPLRGLHQGVACTQCHAKPVFSNVGTNCADCHADIHRRQMGANCEQCHSVKGWNIALQRVREHENRFPLVGGHAGLDCADCHKSAAVGQFQGLATQCYSCHQRTYQQTNAPNHVAAGFSKQCEQCHNINTWLGASFNHDSVGFPLTGGHANLQCDQCHKNGNFQLTSTACVGCHLNDYTKTSNPNHAAAGIPQQCEMCHTIAGWQPALFDHSKTAFPLTGAHAKAQCGDCHKGGNFNLTTAACYSCHQQEYQATNNPNHISVNFPQQCEVCHSTSAWTPAVFNHNNTSFPLTGKHTSVVCTDCHKNNNYTSIATTCYGCHSPEYNTTNSPNHVTAGFPQTCELCHTTSNWTSATFNHASTGWPLTGAHTSLQCSQCHGTSNYNLTNTACVGCHLTEYQKTNDPNHIASNFPQQCDVCHSTSGWTPAIFNHNNTSFPLTGAHTSLACAKCHVNNNYTTLPTDCVGCHLPEYQATNNPNHIAAGFPNTCAVCHNTTNWSGAVFNHTYFPTNHGNANGVCVTCHTNPSDYSVFQCTNCHTKGNTDGDHRGVSGYVYNSVNCYQCHRNGRGG